MTNAPASAAAEMARRMIRLFMIGRPSSEKATAPAALRAGMSTSSSPREPRVTAATGRILTMALRAASARMAPVTAGSSLTGFVLGIAQTVVKPPRAAARAPVAMVSLAS